MSWIKRSIFHSFLWMIFMVVLSIGFGWYINSHPLPGTSTQAARFGKLGEGVGILLPLGILAIWIDAYKKRAKKNKI